MFPLRSGIEPGSTAWQAAPLPRSQLVSLSPYFTKKRRNLERKREAGRCVDSQTDHSVSGENTTSQIWNITNPDEVLKYERFASRKRNGINFNCERCMGFRVWVFRSFDFENNSFWRTQNWKETSQSWLVWCLRRWRFSKTRNTFLMCAGRVQSPSSP